MLCHFVVPLFRLWLSASADRREEKIEFIAPCKTAKMKALKRIIELEGLPALSRDELQSVAEASPGDLRQSIMALQFMYRPGSLPVAPEPHKPPTGRSTRGQSKKRGQPKKSQKEKETSEADSLRGAIAAVGSVKTEMWSSFHALGKILYNKRPALLGASTSLPGVPVSYNQGGGGTMTMMQDLNVAHLLEKFTPLIHIARPTTWMERTTGQGWSPPAEEQYGRQKRIGDSQSLCDSSDASKSFVATTKENRKPAQTPICLKEERKDHQKTHNGDHQDDGVGDLGDGAGAEVVTVESDDTDDGKSKENDVKRKISKSRAQALTPIDLLRRVRRSKAATGTPVAKTRPTKAARKHGSSPRATDECPSSPVEPQQLPRELMAPKVTRPPLYFDVEEVLGSVPGEPLGFAMLLHENYLDFMGDVADVAEAADTFAEADRLFLGAPRSSIRRSCDRRIGEETPFGDGDRLFALTTAMGLANANLSPVNPAARQDGARQEGGGRLFQMRPSREGRVRRLAAVREEALGTYFSELTASHGGEWTGRTLRSLTSEVLPHTHLILSATRGEYPGVRDWCTSEMMKFVIKLHQSEFEFGNSKSEVSDGPAAAVLLGPPPLPTSRAEGSHLYFAEDDFVEEIEDE
eukprot:Selendium_serpulae@DN6387_c0_g1_i3.p1